MVLIDLLPLRDNQKRYRFTPQLSKLRMCEALSVDTLCGFGAKIFICCAESIQPGDSPGRSTQGLFGHFSIFFGAVGSVMVRFSGKCFISGRGGGHY